MNSNHRSGRARVLVTAVPIALAALLAIAGPAFAEPIGLTTSLPGPGKVCYQDPGRGMVCEVAKPVVKR